MARAHNWFIDEGGSAKGPFSLRDIQRMLDQGKLSPSAMICPEGTADWRPAASVFASSPKTSRSPSRIGAIQLLVSTLSLFAFAGFVYGAYRSSEKVLRQVEDLETDFQKAHSPGRFVPFDDVPNSCLSDRNSTSCTFTNLSPEAIFTCAGGSLQNKEVPALRLQSLILCSGRLDPGTTRTISAPWVGGFADDICNKDTGFGKSLDWTKCSFHVDGADARGATP